MSNPYQSPEFPSEDQLPEDSDQVQEYPYQARMQPPRKESGSEDCKDRARRVPKYQRWLLLGLLANLVCNLMFVPAIDSSAITLIVWVFLIPVTGFTMVAMYRLASQLTDAGLAVLFTLAMLPPCIALGIILYVNSLATSYLRQCGVNVGFLGVNPDTI